MFKKNNDKMKAKIVSNILSNVELPIGNESIKKETLEKIIDNIATELLKIESLANQALYSRMM